MSLTKKQSIEGLMTYKSLKIVIIVNFHCLTLNCEETKSLCISYAYTSKKFFEKNYSIFLTKLLLHYCKGIDHARKYSYYPQQKFW